MPTQGGLYLLQTLIELGADTAYCVPGESYLAVLDACHHEQSRFRLISCRMEAGAANMAAADGRLTGRPGICFVTRGPGATHASVGVHTAFQDSLPMLLFIGQVSRAHRGREAFQEVDFKAMFAPLAKWTVEIDRAERIGEIVSRAYSVATSGRQGPVVISLPEDVLTDNLENPTPVKALEAVATGPTRAALNQLKTLLDDAERPLAILGGTGWSETAVKQMTTFLTRFDLPAMTAFRRRDLLDNRHPSFVGDGGLGKNPDLARMMRAADLILAVGTRLGDIVTDSYEAFECPVPGQTLVHVHPSPDELNTVYRADLPIASTPSAFAEALGTVKGPNGVVWADWRGKARRSYEAFRMPKAYPGPVNLSEIFHHLSETLPEDAIVCNGAGNYAAWLHRFFEHKQFGTQVAPTSGAMGYGVPAALAAKARHPNREVVAVAGDGCFLMTGQELATAAQYGLPIIVLIVNNGMYGTIRMHQERHYPGRTVGTDLKNPDFAALAEAYGAKGMVVAETGAFPDALDAALKHPGPVVIEIRTDGEQISPAVTLSELRGA